MSGGGVFQNLRRLINVIDELRDVGLQQYINLPRIVVVGTQSAGKSSVLEGIVGMEFLPRGDGVVTRRPLELRLIHDAAALCATARFEGAGGGREFTEMAQVCAEIDRLTDDVAGRNKGIVDKPIVLTITGPECPDLTLVDLPGITRVPLRNSDQTDDIEMLTREMSRRYVEDPRTVILAVIPANQDISTSDALQLARKVDPRGLRTIGVITKLDLMDTGTNAARMISGEEVPLRLGYVAVKNRNQAEIQERKSVRLSAEDETAFFRSHPVYRQMSAHYFGMKNLIDKLTRVLFKHIHNFLPHIKMEISTRQRDLKQRLTELGDGIPQDANQKTQLIWSMINDYCEVFSNVIRGKYDKRLAIYVDPETNALYGGSQIRTIFSNLLKNESQTAGGASTGGKLSGFISGLGFSAETSTSASGLMIDMSDQEIDQAIRMHEGDSLPGFPTPDTFEFLILPHLQKLHFPVLECLDQVAYTMDQLLQHLSVRVFVRFPMLGQEVLELSRALLEGQKETTRTILDHFVNAETGYMFTNDDSYLAAHGAMLSSVPAVPIPAEPPQQQQSFATTGKPGWLHSSSSKEGSNSAGGGTLQQIHNTLFRSSNAPAAASSAGGGAQYSAQFLTEIRARLNSYYSIILRNIRDTAPKTIGHFLVRNVQERLQYELYSSLSDRQVQDKLLGEPDDIVAERESLKKQLGVLAQAATVLQRDPTISNFVSPIADSTFDDQYDWDLRNAGKDQPNATAQVQPLNVNQPFDQTNQLQSSGGLSANTQRVKLNVTLNDVSSGLFDNSKKTAVEVNSSIRGSDPLFDN